VFRRQRWSPGKASCRRSRCGRWWRMSTSFPMMVNPQNTRITNL